MPAGQRRGLPNSRGDSEPGDTLLHHLGAAPSPAPNASTAEAPEGLGLGPLRDKDPTGQELGGAWHRKLPITTPASQSSARQAALTLPSLCPLLRTMGEQQPLPQVGLLPDPWVAAISCPWHVASIETSAAPLQLTPSGAHDSMVGSQGWHPYPCTL